jgi:hypothetical protein
MAQKKRKEEPAKDEKFEWVPPDFNEREFLEKDIKATKLLLVTALMGFILAIIAALTTPISAVIGAVVILGGAVALKWIYPLFKISVKDLDKKTWASNIVLLLLLALGVWIVLMNPPFADYVNPEVNQVQAWVHNNDTGVWTLMTTSNAATLTKVGDYTNITAKVADNAKITAAEIAVYKAGDTPTFTTMTSLGSSKYGFNTDVFNATGQYFYQIRATDSSGKVTLTTPVNFTVSARGA